MTRYDDLEIELRKAQVGVAQGEAALLREMLDEVRRTLAGPGSADDKVAWLTERLGV